MTAEDPVEFNLQGINQVQMKEQIGLNFAAALRSFLRQDPNIVLVGEIRDFETAEIAIKAALTGHLVLSTLHTNDAPSTISRLVNMGIEPFLVATSVNIIQAQRLIRRICSNCKEEMHVPVEGLVEVGFSKEEAAELKIYKGTGCSTCNNTGFKGRVGLYEVMEITDELRELIIIGASAMELRKKGDRTRNDHLARIGALQDSRGYHDDRRSGQGNGRLDPSGGNMLVRAIALSLALLSAWERSSRSQRKRLRPVRKNRASSENRSKNTKSIQKAGGVNIAPARSANSAIAARKRALRLRQLRLARAAQKAKSPTGEVSTPTAAKTKKADKTTTTAVLPSGDNAPTGWKSAQSTPAELQFRVDNSAGDQVGSASISVVGPAVSGVDGGRKSVGGVATTTLRREVIDRMIRENGWVVNDYQKDIAGQPVYVVVAQSQAKNGAVQSQNVLLHRSGRTHLQRCDQFTGAGIRTSRRRIRKGHQFAQEPRPPRPESLKLGEVVSCRWSVVRIHCPLSTDN